MTTEEPINPHIPAPMVEFLQQLKRVLMQPPAQLSYFDMNVTVSSGEVECGYAGCAIGSAALDPWFNRWGLNVVESPYNKFAFQFTLDGGDPLDWNYFLESLASKLELDNSLDLIMLFGGEYMLHAQVDDKGLLEVVPDNGTTQPGDVVKAINHYLVHAVPPDWAYVEDI